jgi:hypothetical protein
LPVTVADLASYQNQVAYRRLQSEVVWSGWWSKAQARVASSIIMNMADKAKVRLQVMLDGF